MGDERDYRLTVNHLVTIFLAVVSAALGYLSKMNWDQTVRQGSEHDKAIAGLTVALDALGRAENKEFAEFQAQIDRRLSQEQASDALTSAELKEAIQRQFVVLEQLAALKAEEVDLRNQLTNGRSERQNFSKDITTRLDQINSRIGDLERENAAIAASIRQQLRGPDQR